MPSIPLISASKQGEKKSLDVQYVQMYSFAFQQETPLLMHATAGVSQTLRIDGSQPCKSRERLMQTAVLPTGVQDRFCENVTGGTLGVFFFPPHFQFCSAAVMGRSVGGKNNYNFLAYADETPDKITITATDCSVRGESSTASPLLQPPRCGCVSVTVVNWAPLNFYFCGVRRPR